MTKVNHNPSAKIVAVQALKRATMRVPPQPKVAINLLSLEFVGCRRRFVRLT